ncbi:MAG: hypothetical protein H0X73_12175 [Chthoniobacterales bacterium]|nr:hypothetical protein [Chthoniobacterales bacterium]
MNPFFRMMIRARDAFDNSIRQILNWNFDPIVLRIVRSFSPRPGGWSLSD